MSDRESRSFTFDAFVAFVVFGLALALLHAAQSIVSIALLAVFLASIAYPTYRRLQQARRFPPWLALLVVMLAFLVVITGLATLLGEAISSFAENLPQLALQVHRQLGGLLDQIERTRMASATVASLRTFQPSDLEGWGLKVVGAVGTILRSLVFSLLLVAFILPSIGGLRSALGKHREQHPAMAGLALSAHASVDYFRLRLRLSALIGIGLTLICAIAGVPIPVLWGLLALFLSFVPVIGLLIAVALPAILVFTHHGPIPALIVVAAAVLLNVVVESVLQPLLARHALEISPAVSFFSLLLWSFVLGPVGAVLAIPITMTLASSLKLDPQTRWLGDLLVGVE